MTNAFDNVTGPVGDAGSHVVNPGKTLGMMDFYPRAGSPLKGAPVDLSSVSGDMDYQRDFNGVMKDFTYRGALAGEGTNPGWSPDDDFKPAGSGGSGGATGSSGSAGGSGTSSGNGAGAGSAASGAGGGGVGAAGATTGGATPSGEEGACGCRVTGAGSRGLGAAWLTTLLALVALAWRATSRIAVR
jgi:hypothetical protein